MEEQHSSIFWRLSLVVSVVLLAAASYYKVPPFRHFVDEKCPWVKEQLTKYGIEFAEGPLAAPTSPSNPSSQALQPIEEVRNNASSNPSGPGKPVDVYKLTADLSQLPKTVTILSPVVFPAVTNGKANGKLRVPAGTEVQLVRVGGGKLGVVFTPDGTTANASGAWVWPEETDLSERLKKIPAKQ